MLSVPIFQQPDETTCGPTCLHSIYQYYEKPYSLDSVIDDVDQFEEGGTIGVLLANDALTKGFRVTIYSFNLQIFDPTWFGLNRKEMIDKLKAQLEHKQSAKLKVASEAYIRFLELGGRLKFEDLKSAIIRRYLKKDQPVIAGLSATYLYKSMREFGANLDYDDLRGEPSGHFVVLHGYDRETREVYIADPIKTNPTGNGTFYRMSIDRVINAILLGIVTYDANLIIMTPKKREGVT
ncbi:C39 family peptidase [Rhodohalobacter sp. 8-1]|uniref:C39 family peptidase n=1 Tax=Rhodohalobacter sp. 8-1 TaxID=3131972 RepID=UPI0030EF148A